MPSQDTLDYYDATENRDVRIDLIEAIELVKEKTTVIDCGCGAGRDIEFLRKAGFEVFAYDLEAEAIERCRRRFANDHKVHLAQATFSSFEYVPANLIVADASLFYCAPETFDEVWEKIICALMPGGVFVGSFLGSNDSMVTSSTKGEIDWPIVSDFNELELRQKFSDFNIVKWTEHELDGQKANGSDHHWHIFSVIAVKSAVKSAVKKIVACLQ